MKSMDGKPLPHRILVAAIDVFMERGFDQASMDDVAARAGTTKRTVYAHFGSKEALFRAALAEAVAWFLRDLPPPTDVAQPHAALEAFAARFLELCTTRGSVRLQRVAMSLAERFPELGAMLHREVIEAAESRVAGYLAALARDRGLGGGAEPEAWGARAARQFLDLATAGPRYATLLGAREPLDGPPGPDPSPQVDREPIRHATVLFLTGIGLTSHQPEC
jgi:AcrR family transcriptional regulator